MTGACSASFSISTCAPTGRRLWRCSVSACGPPWLLYLDRTDWKIGRRDVNILMLAVVTKRLRIPLLWTVLDKAGTSNGAERIASMQHYLALFRAVSVKTPLGDREFIGADRIECLLKNDIPFALRVKENTTVERDNGQKLSLTRIAQVGLRLRHPRC